MLLETGQAIADLAGQAWWQVLLNHAIEIVFGVFSPVVSYFLYSFLKLKKLGMQKDTMDNVVKMAVNFAEEQAHKVLKSKEPAKEGPPAKLDLALNFLDTELKEHGIIGQSKNRLIALVEARLHQDRKDSPSPSESPPPK